MWCNLELDPVILLGAEFGAVRSLGRSDLAGVLYYHSSIDLSAFGSHDWRRYYS